MKAAEYYIEKLQMEPHMEGGYFKECLLGEDKISGSDRNLWSSIYFLLCKDEVSNLHRLESDEVWYFHDGAALTIYDFPRWCIVCAEAGLGYRKRRIAPDIGAQGIYFWCCHGK